MGCENKVFKLLIILQPEYIKKFTSLSEGEYGQFFRFIQIDFRMFS